MNELADLHTHTVFSDGLLTPEQLLEKAVARGLSAISVTDHDTLDQCVYINSIIDDYPIEYIDGVEFTCHKEGKEYHILGYAVDLDNRQLKFHLENYRNLRYHRAKRIVEKLGKIGVILNIDFIVNIAGKAPITRPHIAAAMVQKGYAKNLKEAFTGYIGDRAPAYEPKGTVAVEKIIDMINNAGGVAVLAHPGSQITQSTLYSMINSGLDGIEVIHPVHTPELKRYYHTIASQYWLLETGGSDFHGGRDVDEANFGKLGASYSVLESIRYHAGLR